MLPPGLTAQPAELADQSRLRNLLPSAMTVAQLLVGACSCDLVRARLPDAREDERLHRSRHRRGGGPREALLGAIERHRRGAAVRPPPAGWPAALAAFVAEHARNAGDTLYQLRFAGEPGAAPPPAPPVRVRVPEVVARPEGWIQEGPPVVVGR
jgi:hypothetical protein